MTLSNHKILISDDSLHDRNLLCFFAKDLGIKAVTATNVDEALDVVQKETISLIFMDLYIPGKDGITGIRELRSSLGDKCPPIIVCSAHKSEILRETCFRLKVHDFLSKPMTFDIFKEAVEGAIEFNS